MTDVCQPRIVYIRTREHSNILLEFPRGTSKIQMCRIGNHKTFSSLLLILGSVKIIIIQPSETRPTGYASNANPFVLRLLYALVSSETVPIFSILLAATGPLSTLGNMM